MYAKVKLPDEFVKGDCENCPLCVYHASIDDTYDLDGYSNDDGFQDWNECLIKVCNADYPCSNVDGTKDCPQEDCPMEIEYEDLKEKIEIRKNKIGYDMMTLSEKHKIGKPVELEEYLIKTYTNEGEIVLDHCMGSGTTAIACINTKRNYIGFENNITYWEMANKRIEECLHKVKTA